MNIASPIQQALGNDWRKLPFVIQAHYQFLQGQQTQNIVTGIMHIDYPAFVKPLLMLVRLMGGLIDLKGDHMNTRVEKWVRADKPDTLFWKRTIQAPNGKSTVFSSRMEYQQNNEVIEFVGGGGFGLNLKLTVENDMLVYRSNGHLWQIGNIKIPILDVLFLGHGTIIETALSDHSFDLDFKINHPLFGVTYSYGGVFNLNP